MTMEACAACPHQRDCLKVGSCLDKINAQYLASHPNQFPRLMTPTQAKCVMAALRAGQSRRRFTGGGKTGTMIVSLTKFKTHCAAYPEWGAEADRLAKANAKAADYLKGSLNRGKQFPFCKRGLHAMVGDNVGIHTTKGRRYCRACAKATLERPITAEEVLAVRNAINHGWTISKMITGRPVGGGPVDYSQRIVNAHVLFGHCKRDPEFAQFLRQATAGNTKRGQKIRWSRFRSAAARQESNDYYKIRGMIPERNPHRDDIVARIFEDILNGSLKREDVPSRIDRYVGELNRLYPTKFAKFGDSALVSLDEVMFDSGAATRGDSVSRGLWD